ncbi:hypothetical protein B9Z65_9118 [Elsinoe australis]|uniref:Uncharacterized protein n=1 Tax=Elsinoe australis TaxID=40998 RepID=A0A2P8ABT0_9PEZI|nr:hypothetical protein B9Z65_9118 [Elsinoe australis]
MVQSYETLSDKNDNDNAVGKFLAEFPPKDLAKTAALGIGYPPGELKDWLETAFTTISNTLRHEEHLRITALSNRINNENGPALNPAERAMAQELRYDKFFRPAAVTMVSEAAKARLQCTGRSRKWDAKAAVLEDLGKDSLEDATMQRRTAELRLYCSRKSRGWSAKAAFLDDLGEKLGLGIQNKDNDETWFPESDEDCVYVTTQKHIQQAFSKYIQEGEAFLDNLDRPWTIQPDERDFNEPAGAENDEAMIGGDNETDHENDDDENAESEDHEDDSDAEDENDPGAEEENEPAADPNVELNAEHESDDHNNARMMSNHNDGALQERRQQCPE